MPHLQRLILRETRDVMNGDYEIFDFEKKECDAKVVILHSGSERVDGSRTTGLSGGS